MYSTFVCGICTVLFVHGVCTVLVKGSWLQLLRDTNGEVPLCPGNLTCINMQHKSRNYFEHRQLLLVFRHVNEQCASFP